MSALAAWLLVLTILAVLAWAYGPGAAALTALACATTWVATAVAATTERTAPHGD